MARLFGVAVLFTALASLPSAADAVQSQGTGHAPVPGILAPVMPTLDLTRMPVYLPTWLPTMLKGTHLSPGVYVPPSGGSYDATLWTDGPGPGHCNQCGILDISGSMQSLKVYAWTRPARLAN